MDKVMSTRVDESVVHRIHSIAQQLRTTKKAVIENAIRLYAEKVEKENKTDILAQTLGAWRRKETPDQTREKARRAFSRSMRRHQK